MSNYATDVFGEALLNIELGLVSEKAMSELEYCDNWSISDTAATARPTVALHSFLFSTLHAPH